MVMRLKTRAGDGRRWFAVPRAAVLAVLLIGLVACSPKSHNPDRGPFDRAVANLAAAEAISYSGSFAGLTMQSRITKYGDSIGTLTLAGQQFELLNVGGHSYLQAPDGLLPADSSDALSLQNRWVENDDGAVGVVAPSTVAPPALAKQLTGQLAQASGFDNATVGSTPAFVAHLPTADLYVTQSEPNQVLRVAPRGVLPGAPGIVPSLPDFPSLPNLPSPPAAFGSHAASLNLEKLMEPARSAAPGSADDALGFDLGQLSPDEIYETYSDLAANASELTEAADPSVQFTAEATGNVQCTAGCVVNASVTNRVTPGANTSVADSAVTAQMTAQISVDGVPGGICVSAPTPIPANGTGELTCIDPESGALASALLEEKAAQAPQGTVVTVTIEAQVQIQAQAMTVADVQQQVDRLRSERDQATQGRAPPTYPAEGLQIGQVNLGTRQSGKAAPVGLQGLNVPWDSNDEALRIEAVLGGNLPKGTRAVDVYDPRDGGVAISVKTFDPRSPSYVAQPSLIGSKGKGYVDELVNYSKGIDLWNPVVPPDAVSTWVLRVAYPAATTDANMLSQLDSILQYGQSKGIVVQLVPIVG